MKSQFRDRPFSSRFAAMGDAAEAAFEAWAEKHGVAQARYGLNRPPFKQFSKLSSKLRHGPDFICEVKGNKFPHLQTQGDDFSPHFFIETKGCGRDQRVKLKHEDIAALIEWRSFGEEPIGFFVYDSTNNRVSLSLTLTHVEEMKDTLPVDYFVDYGKKKPYWVVSTDLFDWEYLD